MAFDSLFQLGRILRKRLGELYYFLGKESWREGYPKNQFQGGGGTDWIPIKGVVRKDYSRWDFQSDITGKYLGPLSSIFKFLPSYREGLPKVFF